MKLTRPLGILALFIFLFSNSQCTKDYIIEKIYSFHDENIRLGNIDSLRAVDVDDLSGIGLAGGRNGFAFLTTDKGKTWTLIEDSPFKDVYKIQVMEGGKIYVADKSGLYSSKNNGSNWEQLYSDFCKDVQFLNENIGYIITDNWVYKTTDGGNSFFSTDRHQNDPVVHALHFSSSHKGYAVGPQSGKLYTIDGGTKWHIIQADYREPDLNDVSSFNDVMYSVGEKGYRMSDNHQLYNFESDYEWNLYAIDFNNNLGIVVGENSIYACRYDENGTDWKFIANSKGKSFAHTYRDVCVVNDNLAFAAGEKGILTRLTNLDMK